MSVWLGIAIDLVAIVTLVFGIYFPRHRRRDLVAAYIGVNIGVLAVSTVLSSSTVSFGLGMGLFGVLSIIRLRSLQLDQQEIAYYFTSLAIALLAGLTPEPSTLTLGLMLLLVGGMFAGDHPRLFSSYRQLLINVDRAILDERELVNHLEGLLASEVVAAHIDRLDLVNDSTLVTVQVRRRRA